MLEHSRIARAFSRSVAKLTLPFHSTPPQCKRRSCSSCLLQFYFHSTVIIQPNIPFQLLNNAIHLGKVNCVNERGLCQHEQITNYPSLKLYLGRNKHHSFSSVITIPVTNYASLLQDIKPHLRKYDENLLAGIDVDIKQGVHMKHDEF